jgi:hypothetical protein
MKALPERNVPFDQLATMIAIIIDDLFAVNLQNCTIVRFHGKLIKTIARNFQVTIKPDSVVHLTAELLQVYGIGISGGGLSASIDVACAGELPVKQGKRQAPFVPGVGKRVQVRTPQQGSPVYDALPTPWRDNHET